MSTNEIETINDSELDEVTGGKHANAQLQTMLTSIGNSIKDVANSKNSSSDQLLPMMMMLLGGAGGGGGGAAPAAPPPPPQPGTIVKVNVRR